MSVGPIPWSKIRKWAFDRNIGTPDERDELIAVVMHLDGIWLKHAVKKATKPKI